MNLVRQFAHFLYDFLVGDAWELFVGPIAGLVVAWALLSMGLPHVLVGIVVFVAVLIVGAVHLSVAIRGSA